MQLSICIPTFRRAATLENCLTHLHQLLTGQRLTDQVEICISDNASPDHTADVIAAFQKYDWNFRSIRQETNRGFSANLLAAGELARGEYILFHGDDDRITPNGLELIFAAIQRHSPVTFFPSLSDRGLLGAPEVDPSRGFATFPNAFDAVGRLGMFHLTFLGNFIVRRADYFAVYEPRFTQSLYPHVGALITVLQKNGGHYVPHPIFEFDHAEKSWNQPLLSAVDMSRMLTDSLFALNPKHPLVRAVYGRLVRSVPRAILTEKQGRSVDYTNPYQSLHPSNLVDCYRYSRVHASLAVLFWMAARLLPAPLLVRLIGIRPRKVHFEPLQ